MSTQFSPPQNSFSAGEISPLLHQRFDYARFQSGLAKCRGFLPLRQGGFTRAPGTVFRGRTLNDQRGRLINFEFAENDAVVLEFTPLKMRVWRYGQLEPSFELDTPYDAEALDRLVWVQSADVIYLADGTAAIRKLSRFALDDWSIEAVQPSSGPFRTTNTDEGLTVQASGETGSVTLTASFDLFVPEHVWSVLHLQPVDWTNVPLWTGNTDMSVGQLVRRDGRVYQLVQGTNSGVNAPNHTEGVAQVQANPVVTWKFLTDDAGIVRITAVNSPTSATASVIRRLPRSVVDSPTYRWAEGAWSARYGYPKALEIYQQRLCAAGTPSDPRTVWFSAAGDFSDWAPSVADDGSFAYAIAGESSVNRIAWLRRGRNGLHIGALGEEYSTRTTDASKVISPTTVAFEMDSTIGSSAARPLAPRGDPVFVSKDGTRLFEIAYSLQDDGNRALELSLPSEHIGAPGLLEMVFQSAPQRLTWIRRGSGDLAVMLYDPDETILGWATVPLAGGEVEALSVTASEDGSADTVTMIVKRTLGGQVVRCVEELAATFGLLHGALPLADAVHLFCVARLSAAEPTSEWSVPHLAGEEVFAWTDRGGYGPLVADELGNLILPAAVTKAAIGLFDPTHMAETLPIQVQARDGNTTGRQKRLNADLGVAVNQSAAGLISVIERDLGVPERVHKAQPILPRQIAAEITGAHTGVTSIPSTSGAAFELSLRVEPEGGAPLTVAALVPTITELGT